MDLKQQTRFIFVRRAKNERCVYEKICVILPSFLFLSYESEPEKAIDGAQEAGFRRYPAVRAGKLKILGFDKTGASIGLLRTAHRPVGLFCRKTGIFFPGGRIKGKDR